jgi:hypothetical protein
VITPAALLAPIVTMAAAILITSPQVLDLSQNSLGALFVSTCPDIQFARILCCLFMRAMQAATTLILC